MLFKGYLSKRVLYCIKAIAQRHILKSIIDLVFEILFYILLWPFNKLHPIKRRKIMTLF